MNQEQRAAPRKLAESLEQLIDGTILDKYGNHANEVKRSRILKERPDMPIERVRAYEQWGKDQERIKELERQLDEIERVGRMGAA